MKEAIEELIEIYNKYKGKINYKEYRTITEYLSNKGYILVTEEDDIYDEGFIAYVIEVAGYYLKQGLIDDIA